jgi:lactoylglutathione lyase
VTRRLHHVGLEVADLDRSLEFYRDLLGLEVTAEGDGGGPDTDELVDARGLRFRYAELALGADQLLELIQELGHATAPQTPRSRPVVASAPAPAGPLPRVHIGIVVDDIDLAYRRLCDARVSTRSGPVDLQEDGAWRGVRALYASDPDGHTVELLQLP